MKNTFFVIAGMLICTTIGMAVSSYALSSQEDLMSAIFDEANFNISDSNDIKDLESLSAGDGEVPFKNLYLFMYQNSVEAPQELAIEELAKWTEYNKNDLEKIIIDGNTEPIVDNQKQKSINAQSPEFIDAQNMVQERADAEFESMLASKNLSVEDELAWRAQYEKYDRPKTIEEMANNYMTQEAVSQEYQYLVDAYQEEFELQRTNRKIAYEALVNEIFVNNDLSDSANIDLLYDLDLIHAVLFKDTITYPDRSGSSVALSSENELVALDNPEVSLAEDDTYACIGDEELASQIDAFEASHPDFTNENAGTDNDSTNGSSNGDQSVDADSNDSQSQSSFENAMAGIEDLGGLIDELGGESGDWTRSLPCNETFCVTIDLVTETDDAEVSERDYDETDDCIACHIKYLKERMDETMSHSLVPGKVSMNFFEDATCKDAGYFVNLDMNIYTIKKPIDLDSGDAIDDIPSQNTEDLRSEFISLHGFPLPGGSKETFEKTLNDLGCSSLIDLYDMSGANDTLANTIARCQEIVVANDLAKTTMLESNAFEGVFESQNVLYQQVSAEFFSMLYYFQAMKTSLEKTYLTDDAPLNSLINNKEYCQ